MERLTVTPFGRQAMTAGLLASQAAAHAPAAVKSFGKWELFRALCTARKVFGVSDRDLSVLNALLSFLPGERLEEGAGLVVFPSNRALAERAHGMAESTLRRHLAALVAAGLLLRHDSPNGKRYARRDGDGVVVTAFGFDLRLLLVRAPEILAEAEAARAEASAVKRQRERVVLVVRDAVKLLVYGRDAGLAGQWDAWDDGLRLIQRALRRKLELAALTALEAEARAILVALQAAVMPVDNPVVQPEETAKLSGNDGESGRHHQSSKPDSFVSEQADEEEPETTALPPIPLPLVMKACPDFAEYSRVPITTWQELITLAAFVRAMLGITPDAWEGAVRHMGACEASVALACILQRADLIRSPGGYLRSLTTRAANGAFSTGPMVMALLNGGTQRRAA